MAIQFNTSYAAPPSVVGLYISQADLEAVIPADELLQLADRNHDDVLDTAVISTAIGAAAGQLHSYLARRYSLPLAASDSLLMAFIKPGLVNMAWAHLYPRADMVPSALQDQIDDFIKQLTAIRDGEADLPASAPPPATATATQVLYSAAPRVTKGGLP